MLLRRLFLAIALLATVAAAIGCDASNTQDLKGIPGQKPDSIKVYINIDTHPNIAKLCIDGVAFITTSREGDDAVNRVPELDRTCPAWNPESK